MKQILIERRMKLLRKLARINHRIVGTRKHIRRLEYRIGWRTQGKDQAA